LLAVVRLRRDRPQRVDGLADQLLDSRVGESITEWLVF